MEGLMREPRSTGSGTTGHWKKFSDAMNRIGEDEAGKRMDRKKKKKKGKDHPGWKPFDFLKKKSDD
jgi:hypothetical protein